MTDDEIKDKQEETLNQLKKYNNTRKTEIVEDTEGNPTVVTQWTDGIKEPMQEFLDAQDELNKECGISIVETNEEDLEKFRQEGELAPEVIEGVEESYVPPVMSHLCPYCGTMAYVGQIHGMGYCKEKVSYEQ